MISIKGLGLGYFFVAHRMCERSYAGTRSLLIGDKHVHLPMGMHISTHEIRIHPENILSLRFIWHTSYFTLHTSHFTLHTSHSTSTGELEYYVVRVLYLPRVLVQGTCTVKGSWADPLYCIVATTRTTVQIIDSTELLAGNRTQNGTEPSSAGTTI